MKLSPAVSPFSRKGVQIIIITAVLYGFLLAGTKMALQLIPGLEFRFATFIAVVSGMCFGPSGAIGAALGNLIADILNGPKWPALLFPLVLNFFLAYLPYRLWYAIAPHNASLYICSGKTFAKFVLIMLAVAICFAEVLNSEISIFYTNAGTASFRFRLLFCNNFVFPILFGIPILLLLRRESSEIYYPPKSEKKYGGYQLQALAVLLVLCLARYALSLITVLPTWVDCLFLASGIVIMGYVATIPSQYEPSELEHGKIRLIGYKTTFCLLLLAAFILTMFVVVELYVGYDFNSFKENVLNWEWFYGDVLFVIITTFGVIYIAMLAIEKDFSNRVKLLADRTQVLAEANQVGMESEQADAALRPLFMQGNEPKDELETLDKAITAMDYDVKRYVKRITVMLEEKHAMESQLNVANSIQQGILPHLDEINARLQAMGADFYVNGSMKAAKTIGGDMYDCFFMDDDHLVIMVADVSGKGVPASLFMMVTQSLILNSKNEINPAVILARTNDTLAANNDQALFVTMWLGVVELSTGIIAYANAGHNPPLLGYQHSDAKWITGLSGPVLGLMDGMEYKLFATELAKGQRLLLYTDGINEAENGHGGNDCFYGNDRLQAAFAAAFGYEDILYDVHRFVNGAQQSDDMTVLWIERR